MSDPGTGLSLAEEARAQRGRDLEVGNDLERHRALQDRIAGPEDRAHAAPADLADHFVLTDLRSHRGLGSLLIRRVRRDGAPLEIAQSVSQRTFDAQTFPSLGARFSVRDRASSRERVDEVDRRGARERGATSPVGELGQNRTEIP